MKRVVQNPLWAIILLCSESILTAIPTITIFSHAQNGGLHLEGSSLESPGTLRQIKIGGLEEVVMVGGWEPVRYPGLLEKDRTETLPWLTWEMRSSRLRQDLDYITCSVTPITRMSIDCPLTSGMSRTGTMPSYEDSIRWLPRRH